MTGPGKVTPQLVTIKQRSTELRGEVKGALLLSARARRSAASWCGTSRSALLLSDLEQLDVALKLVAEQAHSLDGAIARTLRAAEAANV